MSVGEPEVAMPCTESIWSPSNNSRLSFCQHQFPRLVYSGVCSSYVDVLQVSMGFSGFLSIFLDGETYIQISRQNMTHPGR